MPGRETCRFAWLGVVEYLRARGIQDSLASEVREGKSGNILLLLEHPHVYTRGRLSRDEHLLSAESELAALGVPVYDTDRGGQITYHGPGQLIGYPIINLRTWGGPLQYVRTLERIIIDTLADFRVKAHAEDGLTGVWTASGKIAAIGVKISRGVAFHGFAVNANADLSYYRHIIPCGIADRNVSSMSLELGGNVDLEAVRYSLVYHFGKAMGLKMVSGNLGRSLLGEGDEFGGASAGAAPGAF